MNGGVLIEARHMINCWILRIETRYSVKSDECNQASSREACACVCTAYKKIKLLIIRYKCNKMNVYVNLVG
jgi:hypothetical protein